MLSLLWMGRIRLDRKRFGFNPKQKVMKEIHQLRYDYARDIDISPLRIIVDYDFFWLGAYGNTMSMELKKDGEI
jgi:hypothetical protein